MLETCAGVFCRTGEEQQTNRRGALKLVVATLVAPGLALGQASRHYRLGWLFTTDPPTTDPLFGAFLGRMRALGYVEGRNLINDLRWARGNAASYPALADELIALKPDILLGIQEAALALAAKTSVIPIVLTASADPVRAGLVKTLARPGTNVTGMAGLYDQLVAKQIELLIEILPKMSRVAFLNDSASATREDWARSVSRAANAKRLTLTVAHASDVEGIGRAFDEFAAHRAEALVVSPSGTMTFFRRDIARRSLRLRVPSVSGLSQYADSGGLINYSPQLIQSFGNEVPGFVDRILRGANPAELPVQQVTKYEFVVNLKTARAIGLAMPQSILLRADRMIE